MNAQNLANKFAKEVDNARYAANENEGEIYIRRAVEAQIKIESELAKLRTELAILERVENSRAWYAVLKEAR